VQALALAVLTSTLLATAPARVVTGDGRIGALRIDRSTRAAVVSAAGRPDAERVGVVDGSRRYRALGYGCSNKESDVTWPLHAHGPYCHTVFFLDLRAGTVRTFFTTSPRYREEHGVRIGMPTATAERLLHRRVVVGCEENAYLGRGGVSLTVAFAGGHRARDGHLVGGRVYAFALTSRTHDLGVFDCL
jgi:hypothetical protein